MSKKKNRSGNTKNITVTIPVEVTVQDTTENTSVEATNANDEVNAIDENTERNDLFIATDNVEYNEQTSNENPTEEVVAENTETKESIIETAAENTLPEEEKATSEPKVKQNKAVKRKTPTIEKAKSTKRVKLSGTSYHYFRNWLKELLRSNGISSAKFEKDEIGWNGNITIASNEKDQALKVLADYRTANSDVKDLWW